jgi:purine-binding chemotaxis protein CheW
MPEIPQNTKELIREVAGKTSKPEEKIVPMEQLVTFELDKEEFASSITDLREIIVVPEIVPIPNAPDFIRGILNLRGQIVLVLDLEKRFHLQRENDNITSRHVIIIEVNDSWYGVTVDEVTGVLRVPADSIKPTPSLVSSKISEEFVKGVVVLTAEEQENNEIEVPEKVQAAQTTTKKQDEAKKTKPTQQSRLVLLIDFMRLLSEKELVEMGAALKETAKSVNVKKPKK